MAARLILALAVAVLVAACASGSADVPTPVPPGQSDGPTSTVGPAVAQTRVDLVRALGTKNLVLDSQAPFRPPEDATFTRTPRALYQVIPQGAAGRLHRRLRVRRPDVGRRGRHRPGGLPRGPAKVQSPFGARHIIRLVGPTVVITRGCPRASRTRSAGHPAGARDLGTGVPVPPTDGPSDRSYASSRASGGSGRA